ncbi:hypothetical protein PanWU01x14_188770, partial [Parasponia andersonii]
SAIEKDISEKIAHKGRRIAIKKILEEIQNLPIYQIAMRVQMYSSLFQMKNIRMIGSLTKESLIVINSRLFFFRLCVVHLFKILMRMNKLHNGGIRWFGNKQGTTAKATVYFI